MRSMKAAALDNLLTGVEIEDGDNLPHPQPSSTQEEERVHPLRCTNSFEKGLLETLEDKGDKGDSTETKKDICSHWDVPGRKELEPLLFPLPQGSRTTNTKD
ncbi:MAG: hypothetical protein Fur006_50800 [Coleofasciculaceae cyanobacterium]